MAKINSSDNMNQGLPEETGLDAGTRASLQRQLDGGDDGIVVGSFRDLQVGETSQPVMDRPVNPNVPEDAKLVTPGEQDAAVGVQTQTTEEEGIKVDTGEDAGSKKKK